MKEEEGWVRIKKFTVDGKPVCGDCLWYGKPRLCPFGSFDFTGKWPVSIPNSRCPIWHGESKSEWQPSITKSGNMARSYSTIDISVYLGSQEK